MSSTLTRQVIDACKKAGRSLLHDFNEVEQLQISRKGPADFVSIADKQAENILKEELLKIKPDAGFIGEESEAHNPKSDEKWIVDPLDGTHNFLHGVPHFAISVAWLSEGKIQIGVIYEPASGDIYTAEAGNGAFMNRKRIRVSKRDEIEYTLLEADMKAEARKLPIMERLPSYVSLRSKGSVALSMAYLASGKIDASWWCNVKPWDVAAGLVLIQEAGGFCSSFDGEPYKLGSQQILNTNAQIHNTIVKLMKAK